MTQMSFPTRSLPLSPQRAAAELLRRRTIRRSLTEWCRHALAPLGHAPAAHHLLLIRELERVAAAPDGRLIVTMPPGSAKSTYASVLFPAWFLAQRPNLAVIGASHTATLAETFSRRIQSVIRDNTRALDYGLTRESAEQWDTTTGGSYKAAGVGGPITGFRADLAIIDDPVKSRADADSETYRERAWNWYGADLRTRLKPGASIVLIQTRWHEDDLAGRLLLTNADGWRVLSLPAIAGDNDALGRAPGEWLWSDDGYGYAAGLHGVLDEYERAGAMRDWHALYQQNPRPAEGLIFRVAQIGVVDAAPSNGRIVRAWDLAATAEAGSRDSDWTVGAKLMRTAEGRFVVLDVVRFRGGPEDVERAIVNTAAQDGNGVTVGLPQDPGQAGKSQVLYLTRKLAGRRVESTVETGDKAERAMPLAAQCNVGNVSVMQAPWTRALLDELGAFPAGKHDDQVDALSRAFSMLIAPPDPARRIQLPIMAR